MPKPKLAHGRVVSKRKQVHEGLLQLTISEHHSHSQGSSILVLAALSVDRAGND
jgi:hypothetical protein